jgi:hypothetical protein
VHKVKLFPLSLSSAAFNWFTLLAPNSVSTWAGLEEKFHEYFYNRETELKLSDLTAVQQKYSESVVEYIKRFRETCNKCYSLTVRGRDLADLALAGLSLYLREELEGMDLTNVNQVLQHVVAYENRARDNHSNNQFREASKEMDRGSVGLVEDNVNIDEDTEICVAEWVDTTKSKPMMCSFLKPGPEKKDEMCFTFDVTKCDKLFEVLLQHNVIKLKEGHINPMAEQLA